MKVTIEISDRDYQDMRAHLAQVNPLGRVLVGVVALHAVECQNCGTPQASATRREYELVHCDACHEAQLDYGFLHCPEAFECAVCGECKRSATDERGHVCTDCERAAQHVEPTTYPVARADGRIVHVTVPEND